MTFPSSGGVVIKTISTKNTFDKQYKKLPPEIQKLVESKLKDLQKEPMPSGLRFEKLRVFLSGAPNVTIMAFHAVDQAILYERQ